MKRTLRTSKGLEVELRYRWDIDDGICNGWVVHQVDAYVDGEAVGYLKISYVDQQGFREFFSDPLHFAAHRGRMLRTRHLLEEGPMEEWGERELRIAVFDSYGWLPYDQERELDQLNEDELRLRWQERQAAVNERYAAEYANFLSYHLDKPQVDFIRVVGEDFGGGPDWRRQGIATLLYEAGAAWMAEHGLKLWSSGVQTDEVALGGLWQGLADRYQVDEEIRHHANGAEWTRRSLDGSQINLDHERPQLASLEAGQERSTAMRKEAPEDISARYR